MPKAKPIPLPEEILEEEKKEKQLIEIGGNAHMARLTERKRKLAQELLLNPTQPFAEAARKAGYKLGKNSKASVIKREIAGKLSATFREMGLFESDLAKVIVEGMTANKYHLVKVPIFHDNGQLKTFRHDVIETPDHLARIAAAKQLALLGDYNPAQKFSIDSKHTNENRLFAQVDVRVLEGRAKELRSKAKPVTTDFIVLEENDELAIPARAN